MPLSRDQIIAVDDRRFAEVEIPEWGGLVRLASMSAKDRLRWAEFSKQHEGGDRTLGLRWLITKSIVDAEGNRILREDDIDALNSKDGEILRQLWEKALEINGLGAKSIETARKNLSSEPIADSPSGSLSLSVA